jgi:hypothetical protein
VIDTIDVGAGPWSVSSDATHVWTANSGENAVSEILISPPCTAVQGVGHIAPKGKEGENLGVHLTTSGGSFTTTTPNGAAEFALTHLNTASCVQTAGGYEFNGHATARMRKVNGDEMVFSFATEGGKTYLSLEVTEHGTVVYNIIHEPLTKGSKVKIS